MKEIDAYSRTEDMNNNNFTTSIAGPLYTKESFKARDDGFTKYNQAEFIEHSFDLNMRKRDSWSLNETIQKLYDLDSDTSRRMFLDEYFNFMKKRGAVVTKIPVVAKLPLDLYRLYDAVQSFGGYAQVVKKRKWSRVVRDLGLPPSITSAAYTLRTQYLRLLYHFECKKNGVAANNLFFYEEQESIKEMSAGCNQHYENSPPSSKRFKMEDSDYRRDKYEEKNDLEEHDGLFHDSKVTFVELSRDKKMSLNESYKEPSKCHIPPRPRSEETFRRHSIEHENTMNCRSKSLNDILKRTKQCDERETRKRKLPGEYSPENIFTDDRCSMKSMSPSPNEGMLSGESTMETASMQHNIAMHDDQNNGRDNDRFAERPFHRSSSMVNSNYVSKHHQNHQHHQQSHHHHHQHHHRSENNGLQIYPSRISPVKLSCQCEDCEIVKQRLHYNGESRHPDSISPSQIVPKNGIASAHHYNGYAGHAKRHQQVLSDDELTLERYDNYKTAAHKTNKPSTSLTEMSLNIQHRTENSVVLSIVLDGVYYSGKLLMSSLKR